MTRKTPDQTLGYGDYLRFRELVLERSGLHFPEKKRGDLENGLFKALAASPLPLANGTHNLDHYYHLLADKNNPAGRAEMERLINLLTVGETHFFRDEAQFSALATHVLPALIARKRAAAAAAGFNIQPQLRIWSAGCATGEEPYSIAILLKELLPDLANWRILILATDINQESLKRAQEALYSGWSFRESRAKTLRPHYFTHNPETKRYRLRPEIQQMVTFASLNLIEDDYPAVHNNTVGLDLILCRNVTIYFTEATTRKVIKQFYNSLVEGGWLVVGHSEPSLLVYRAFQPVAFPDAFLYQKTGRPLPLPDNWGAPVGPLEKNKPSPANGAGSTLPAKTVFPASGPKKETQQIQFSKRPPSIPPAGGEVSRFSPRRGELEGGSQVKPGAPASASHPSEVDPYERACNLLNEGRATAAIETLRCKLAVDSNFAPAHALLGRAYANLGRWEEARCWCHSALKLDKTLPEAYYTLGLIYQHQEQLDQAIEMFKKAIYLKRDAALFHFNLAMLYQKKGRTPDAQRSCRNVIKILEQAAPTDLIPDANGATVKHLLKTTRWILNNLERGNQNA